MIHKIEKDMYIKKDSIKNKELKNPYLKTGTKGLRHRRQSRDSHTYL